MEAERLRRRRGDDRSDWADNWGRERCGDRKRRARSWEREDRDEDRERRSDKRERRHRHRSRSRSPEEGREKGREGRRNRRSRRSGSRSTRRPSRGEGEDEDEDRDYRRRRRDRKRSRSPDREDDDEERHKRMRREHSSERPHRRRHPSRSTASPSRIASPSRSEKHSDSADRVSHQSSTAQNTQDSEETLVVREDELRAWLKAKGKAKASEPTSLPPPSDTRSPSRWRGKKGHLDFFCGQLLDHCREVTRRFCRLGRSLAKSEQSARVEMRERAISDPAGAPHNGPRTVLDALSRPLSICSTPSSAVSHLPRDPAHRRRSLPTLFSSAQTPRSRSTFGVQTTLSGHPRCASQPALIALAQPHA